ncbi:SMI1/KNR4 family protein [Streptomyces sp. AC555_RSS877]|uniref:SMI1/KNR4 family protein n=1 Tax=Streptomyces sp. AC555_RSS877 TaxID=2823688 RepID=UPI001C265C39|nr:SMI1/KNR4 family protein [Streptomyces sp. AC555_RSS877]
MPPPSSPPIAPPWQDARAQIGFQFPADYRAFVDRYGAGEINDHLIVFAPTERPYQPGLPGGFRGYTAFAEQDIGTAFAAMRDGDPCNHPYPLFPHPGGLLVWGRTYDGDHLFWNTEDPDPDRWPVVTWLRHEPSPGWRPYDGTATDFLLALATHSHPHTGVLIGNPAQQPRWVIAEDWTRTYDPPPETDE